MQANKILVVKCSGLFFATQKIWWSYVILRKEGLKAWVSRISGTIYVDQNSRQIELLIVIDDRRLSTQNSEAVINRSETIIGVTHVPVDESYP